MLIKLPRQCLGNLHAPLVAVVHAHHRVEELVPHLSVGELNPCEQVKTMVLCRT